MKDFFCQEFKNKTLTNLEGTVAMFFSSFLRSFYNAKQNVRVKSALVSLVQNNNAVPKQVKDKQNQKYDTKNYAIHKHAHAQTHKLKHTHTHTHTHYA